MIADDAAGVEIPRRTHRPRVIPVLLLKGNLLYKTVRFGEPKYVGDPRIAVKIFNDKGADELVLLDITATPQGREPAYDLLEEIASEAFMPVGYGGGLRTFDQIRKVLRLGVEKVIINTHAVENPYVITEAARAFGSQSVVGAIDVKHMRLRGPRVWTGCGRTNTRMSPALVAKQMAEAGAGEILVNSIDRDGTFKGYDTELVRQISEAVEIPVIACGGAGKTSDLLQAVKAGASAAAAGSLFVFQLPHRAVLITFPAEADLATLFGPSGGA